MKKHVLLLMLLTFSFGAQSQPHNSVSRNDCCIHYDTDAYWGSINYNPEGNLMNWAVMFPSDKLQPFENYTLTKVAYYKVNDVGEIIISIYYGNNNAPVSLMTEQTFSTDGIDIGYHYIELEQPVEIDVTQNLWIVFSETKVDQSAPGTCCKFHYTPLTPIDPDPNGRWVCGYPGYWEDFARYGWNEIQWKIRGYLTDGQTGIEKPLSYDVPSIYPNPTSGQFTVENGSMDKAEVYNLVGHKVYEAEGQSASIDASNWNKGIYLVNIIEHNGAVTTQKLEIK